MKLIILDRDGVINHDKIGSYIFNADEFVFMPGAKEAIKFFSEVFGTIVVATNQKGVAKGLMSLSDLNGIHAYMQKEISSSGGRIDKIYFAIDMDNDSPMRKPQTGMALQAKKDFPQIDFAKSIMVGNRISDMEFGRNAGMATVFLRTTHPETEFPHGDEPQTARPSISATSSMRSTTRRCHLCWRWQARADAKRRCATAVFWALNRHSGAR